jgi:hypothetical protein
MLFSSFKSGEFTVAITAKDIAQANFRFDCQEEVLYLNY